MIRKALEEAYIAAYGTYGTKHLHKRLMNSHINEIMAKYNCGTCGNSHNGDVRVKCPIVGHLDPKVRIFCCNQWKEKNESI